MAVAKSHDQSIILFIVNKYMFVFVTYAVRKTLNFHLDI